MNVRTFRYEVWSRETDEFTAANNRWIRTSHQIGINGLTGCFNARVFFVRGQVTNAEAHSLGQQLLADPVTEQFTVVALPDTAPVPSLEFDHTIDITFLAGVTDPVADNLLRAAELLGTCGVEQAATGQRYYLRGDLSTTALDNLATRVFSNPVIQRCEIDRPITPPFVEPVIASDAVEVIDICDADDNSLLAISAERRLALDLAEMQAIRNYFQHEGRNPTDVEIEMLAQTWSEHCIHKTFRAIIEYTGPEPGQPADSPPVKQTINGLLRQYIRAATEKINKPWIRSTFVDNAGIIAFDNKFDLAFKVETHNHPSAIEPFGGANTGVGGVVRDVLGVSARPIANTDVLCFGPVDLPDDQLLAGSLHPRRIADGVVHGIEDYGNKMGIPTVNGSVLYHPGYTANPLVFCGCLGILPHGTHRTQVHPGDLIIVLGGKTGRDGLRGATFSSMEMDGSTGEIAGSSVQIGNPIEERQVQEVILQTRDAGLYSAITDCGAGGLSSAVGEMASETGARVQLDSVPLKYPGLQPWEIWLSEAQERMVMAVPPDHWEALKAISAGQDVEATCIGEFNASGHVTLYYGDRLVGDIAVDFLHEGIPTRLLEAVWEPVEQQNSESISEPDFNETLLRLLAHPNIRSKESIIRRYDHEVQGGTIVKPLVGADNHGPGDAAVLVPLDTGHKTHQGSYPKGVAISNGICPQYGEIDPYAMAWAAVDEAVRNAVAVGADPEQIAILDNFCWGNPTLPDRLGSLVRCVQGCYDAALAYGTPFISGKDSLNNEYADSSGQRHAIPGTLLISAVGIVPDVQHTVTMDLKQPGNRLYVVGETQHELGGSHYHLLHKLTGGTVPQPKPDAAVTMQALHRAIKAGLVQACHDVSEGGIAVALAEMCLAGRLGADVYTEAIHNDQLDSTFDDVDAALFSESLSRFIIEVKPDDATRVEAIFSGLPLFMFGTVKSHTHLRIQRGLFVRPIEDNVLVDLSVEELETAWRGQGLAASTTQATQGTIRPPAPSPVAYLNKRPPIMILHANGTNRDRDAALACQLAGGAPEIVHINQLLNGERQLLDYQMLVVPGGFSYGDDLGAGVLWALDLRSRLAGQMTAFVEGGRLVLGICNGFQALVKSGLLPGRDFVESSSRPATLTYNQQAQFECRWVYLKPDPTSNSVFTRELDEFIYCPVAHGEGRIALSDPRVEQRLFDEGLVPLTYVEADGSAASYPANPNGSVAGIAALTNRAGNVMGLMPHPENHIFPWQHPRWHRGESGFSGLRLFENGIQYVKEM